MSTGPRITIDQDLGTEYRDAGPWRAYHVMTSGDSLGELIANAVISEIDQDGGEIVTYDLPDASNAVQESALRLIAEIHRKASAA
jgi:hypothetical protein